MRAIACWVVFLRFLVQGLAGEQVPVKLEVEVNGLVVRAGEAVPIRVRLLDAANHSVKAPKRFEVLLQARLASGEVKVLRTVELAPGESSKELTITLPATGLVYLWAKHAELLPGGAFVKVRASMTSRSPASDKVRSREPAASRSPAPTALPAPAPDLKPPASMVPKLALRYSPDRRFLADGKDAAAVQAFLLSEPASVASDIRLNVFDSSGTMQPTPLIIRKGEESGRSALTFNNPGTVTVEFLSSAPAAELEGARKLEIEFMPPITHLVLEASPPAISLVDTTDLVATLADDQGRPVSSDVARHVTFAIQSGRGEIARSDLEIAAGQFQARSTFQPVSLGRVEVSASTPNLLNVAVPVQVSPPTVLLLFSLAGGLAGGYFSYLKRRRSGRRRIAIGLVTGFVFYWACIFLGLAAAGHAVVVNPLSAFALSTIGGWLQTEVFTMIGSRVRAK